MNNPTVRALVIANRLPYPVDDGWKRRTLHLLKALATRYHVTLVTFHSDSNAAALGLESELGGNLEVHTLRTSRLAGPRSLLLGLLTGRPFHVWRLDSAAMRRTIAQLAGRPFDVGIATLIHLHPYLRDLDRGTLRVVDTHNVDSLVLRRYAARMKGPRSWYAQHSADKLQRHEREVFADADLVWVCSEEERKLVAASAPGARVVVVPNGVDTEVFTPLPPDLVSGQRLVYFGRLDYFPNADAISYFAREILPLIRREVDTAELHVVGPGAGEELYALARTTPGVRILGVVPDLRPVIGSAAAVVVPLRSGGGTRLKILEALALGRPVISTTLGAEGLALEPGREIFIEDEPAAFAGRAAQLLKAPELAAQVGRAGRERVRERYDWRGIERELLAGLDRTTIAHRSPLTDSAA